MDNLKHKHRRIRHIISLPILWSALIPIIILDLWAELYHRTCFPLYGMKYEKRSKHLKIDRHKLKYLSFNQKLGCMYCGYANGLASYFTAIAARTEQYWCGIMHEKDKNFKAPKHHKNFVKYGDEKAFKKRYK